MVVSFKGISNIDLSRNKEDSFYIDVSCEKYNDFKAFPRKLDSVSLTCTLSDDEDGKDLGDFYSAMYNSKVNCGNLDSPDKVEIKLFDSTVIDDEENPNRFSIKLNGKKLDVDGKDSYSNIPLFNYIENLTSKLMDKDDLDDAQKDALRLVNEKSKKAVDLIV